MHAITDCADNSLFLITKLYLGCCRLRRLSLRVSYSSTRLTQLAAREPHQSCTLTLTKLWTNFSLRWMGMIPL